MNKRPPSRTSLCLFNQKGHAASLLCGSWEVGNDVKRKARPDGVGSWENSQEAIEIIQVRTDRR